MEGQKAPGVLINQAAVHTTQQNRGKANMWTVVAVLQSLYTGHCVAVHNGAPQYSLRQGPISFATTCMSPGQYKQWIVSLQAFGLLAGAFYLDKEPQSKHLAGAQTDVIVGLACWLGLSRASERWKPLHCRFLLCGRCRNAEQLGPYQLHPIMCTGQHLEVCGQLRQHRPAPSPCLLAGPARHERSNKELQTSTKQS